MSEHSRRDLVLGVDKPDNVYRLIERWVMVPSSHGTEVHYLIMKGVFQWGANRERPVNGYAIAIQYSSEPGHSVDLSQPAHIPIEDMPSVLAALSDFAAGAD